MTQQEALKILAVLKSVYPSIGRDDPKGTAKAWAVALNDAPYAAISKATADYIRAEHFPPTPADLLRYAKKYDRSAAGWLEKLWADAVETGCLTPENVTAARLACYGAARLPEKGGMT